MVERSPEQKAFLKLALPPGYEQVQPAIHDLLEYLDDPANYADKPDKVGSKRKLVGLGDPEPTTPFDELIVTAKRAIESIRLDRGNASAYYLLARAMCEMARYDEETSHPVPVREAIDLAERCREMAPKVGKAWRALIECYMQLRRPELVGELLNELARLGSAPGTHAILSARFSEQNELYSESIEWYQKAISYIAEPSRRAEVHARQATVYIRMDNKGDAERCFMLAMLEGGKVAWIAHNWSILKLDRGDLAGATELSRRTLMFDPEFGPALEFKPFLADQYARNDEPYPGAVPLQEETLRGIALPGCDPVIVSAAKLQEWQPPRRGARARATRTFRSGLEGE